MKSFSSSAINKSGKKFAPKAPVRRAVPGAAAPARRPSAVQQAQTQAAQASQQEREAPSSAPQYSVPSVEPEPPAILDETPITVSNSQPSVQVTSNQATPIPVPQPKRKSSVSAPIRRGSITAAITPTPTPDVPTSPRTLPTEPPLVPSIEQDIEQSVARDVAAEAGHSAADVGAPSGTSSGHEPAPEVRGTSFTPIERPTKRAKKTSEITKSYQRRQAHSRTPSLSTPAASQANVSTVEGTNETPSASVAPSTLGPSEASAKGKKRKTSKAGTDASGAGKPKQVRRRKREATPEGAEMVEILPNVIKMSELCKDLKTGKKSKRETELRRLELVEMERKQKAQEEGARTRTPIKKPNEPETNQGDRLPEFKSQSGPVMRIVNGEIVLDTASLEVDRHADVARNAGELEDVVENQFTRRINQATYGKRSKTETWDEEMTDLFYRGLRMFGTDFMVISKLFPGRSRRQIKLKFNNEERRDPQRIKDTLLGPREIIDIATYSAMTNTVYDNPKVIQQELDDEKKRIEEEHAKEKALQEEMLRNPMNTGADDAAADSSKANGAPAKGKARNKKQNKNLGGGTEVILGPIDDFAIP
ncbi:uncharacterized protein N7459_009682 [Penicillium hispanicum]|uniref:uncharacterized protein n=1 Tax=Penicillium hispanicum TaxID=1080232 RepID=UPI0025415BAA|nr:uncharacterized protein N7459_009682 [Penicillium hispanicum]KAJ5570252.1 hypothetical protein N7459_009682 [Penicillium hispanicum]